MPAAAGIGPTVLCNARFAPVVNRFAPGADIPLDKFRRLDKLIPPRLNSLGVVPPATGITKMFEREQPIIAKIK